MGFQDIFDGTGVLYWSITIAVWMVTIAYLMFNRQQNSMLTSTIVSSTEPSLRRLQGKIDLIEAQAKRLASHSWEYGTVSHALLSLHNPGLTVFFPSAFPDHGIPKPLPSPLPPGLAYAKEHIDISTETNSLYPADTSCLLYTSPSPRDGLLSRMPSSA